MFFEAIPGKALKQCPYLSTKSASKGTSLLTWVEELLDVPPSESWPLRR
jgi:hypothetical protein